MTRKFASAPLQVRVELKGAAATIRLLIAALHPLFIDNPLAISEH